MEHILLWAVAVMAAVVYVATAVAALAWYRHAQSYKRLHASQREITERYRRLYEAQMERTRRWRAAAILAEFRR